MYGDDVRAFADALYLDHGHTYEDTYGPRPSGVVGTSNGPAAAGALASGYVLPCRQRGTSCGCPSTAPVACVDKALCVGRAAMETVWAAKISHSRGRCVLCAMCARLEESACA